MAFDGFVTRCIADELNKTILNGKIDKIYQPEKDMIVFSIRTYNGTYRLLMSSSGANARVHLTSRKSENPMVPPAFCMLLRKKLSGAVISKIEQPGFDRVLKIYADARNEMGDICTFTVIAEIMGRHSNIILTDENNRISDCARHVDYTVSAVRQVLPGLFYDEPPKQDKAEATAVSSVELMNDIESLSDDTMLDKFLLDKFMGMSPLLAREIVYGYFGNTKVSRRGIDTAGFVVYVSSFLKDLCDNRFSPSIVIDGRESKPTEFSCVNLAQYEGAACVKKFDSISEVIDDYYETRAKKEYMDRRSAAILKLLNNNIERCEKKIVLHGDNIENAKKREKFKIYGDLITANIYRLKGGERLVKVVNYYSENSEEIEIPLKEELSPSQNAQRYYKKYNKEKTAEAYSKEQLKIARDEKYYLESVKASVENAVEPFELDEIRRELVDGKYISEKSNSGKKNVRPSEPRKFVSDDGYVILVGRNNRQNDELTLKKAFSTDIWFHTKQIPGSHTIIRTNGTGEASDAAIMKAAKLAAFYSKAKNSSQVPVDYTVVKNVKKPNGAKPGMVIYDRYNTLYVMPENFEEYTNVAVSEQN